MRVILYKSGWKEEVKTIWLKEKLGHMDMRGINGHIRETCERCGIDFKAFMQAYCFRGLLKESWRMYADMVTLTPAGYEEMKESMKTSPSPETFHPTEDIADDVEGFDKSEFATSFEELIKHVNILMKDSNEVFLRITAEKPITLEKSDNGTLCIIAKEEVYPRLEVVSRVLERQTQYISFYIGGCGSYPDLSRGLRFIEDKGNYHATRIHKDDIDEFIRRIKEYTRDLYE